MKELISLCGDNCAACPRYLARSAGELKSVAELWFRIGWRDHICSNEEMRCSGCSPEKQCTYRLVDCTRDHGVEKCGCCGEFPCEKSGICWNARRSISAFAGSAAPRRNTNSWNSHFSKRKRI